jgi:hypothetical protein
MKENSSFLTYYAVSKDCLTLKAEVLFVVCLFVFLALQPIVIVFSQSGSGL